MNLEWTLYTKWNKVVIKRKKKTIWFYLHGVNNTAKITWTESRKMAVKGRSHGTTGSYHLMGKEFPCCTETSVNGWRSRMSSMWMNFTQQLADCAHQCNSSRAGEMAKTLADQTREPEFVSTELAERGYSSPPVISASEGRDQDLTGSWLRTLAISASSNWLDSLPQRISWNGKLRRGLCQSWVLHAQVLTCQSSCLVVS